MIQAAAQPPEVAAAGGGEAAAAAEALAVVDVAACLLVSVAAAEAGDGQQQQEQGQQQEAADLLAGQAAVQEEKPQGQQHQQPTVKQEPGPGPDSKLPQPATPLQPAKQEQLPQGSGCSRDPRLLQHNTAAANLSPAATPTPPRPPVRRCAGAWCQPSLQQRQRCHC